MQDEKMGEKTYQSQNRIHEVISKCGKNGSTDFRCPVIRLLHYVMKN